MLPSPTGGLLGAILICLKFPTALNMIYHGDDDNDDIREKSTGDLITRTLPTPTESFRCNIVLFNIPNRTLHAILGTIMMVMFNRRGDDEMMAMMKGHY